MKFNFLICLMCIVLTACSLDRHISEKIGDQIKSSGEVKLSDLTGFDWDKVYIYSPYTTKKQICSELLSAWPSCSKDLPKNVPESLYFIIFTLYGKHVYHELHSRANGDFCRISCVLQLSKDEAVFNAVPYAKSVRGNLLYELRQKSI